MTRGLINTSSQPEQTFIYVFSILIEDDRIRLLTELDFFTEEGLTEDVSVAGPSRSDVIESLYGENSFLHEWRQETLSAELKFG